jgi:hypothetical protein
VTTDLFVTLNPPELPQTSKLIKTIKYSHPQYTVDAVKGQEQIKHIQGKRRTWFCGAYLGYGFHEDGLKSGLDVAHRMSGKLAPWWKATILWRTPFASLVEADEDEQSKCKDSEVDSSEATTEGLQRISKGEPKSRDSKGRIHSSYIADADDQDIPGTIQHALKRQRCEAIHQVETRLQQRLDGLEPITRFTHLDENPEVQWLVGDSGSTLEHLKDGANTLKNSAMKALTIPVLKFLGQGIREGCVVLRLPDSLESVFGDTASKHRATIYVHRWSFFLRVCAEADLGLARAYIAGDWSCDNLATLFRVFIFNRDSETAKLDTKKLWTSWIGTLLNSVSYKYFLDNSIAGKVPSLV